MSSEGIFEDTLLDADKKTGYIFRKPGTYHFYLRGREDLNGTVTVEP